MELFCPACQKKLTIEDRYAGQMMQCPMCQATFTAPALPSYAASASSLPTSPPAAPPAVPPHMPPSQPGGGFPATVPPPHGAPPGYGQFQPGPPPAPRQPAVPYVPPARSTDYHQKFTAWLSPTVLQWVPVAAIVLIFFLTFFTWVWIGLLDGPAITQNGWQAGFGGYSVVGSAKPKEAFGDEHAGVSVLTIFYLLLLIPCILLIVAAAVVGAARIPVPASLHMVLSFRWIIAGALCLLMFFLLILQLMVWFGAESKCYHEISTKFQKEITEAQNAGAKVEFPTSPRGMALIALHRTFALDLVFWLHLLAVIVCGYMVYLEMRKTAPVPKIELHW